MFYIKANYSLWNTIKTLKDRLIARAYRKRGHHRHYEVYLFREYNNLSLDGSAMVPDLQWTHSSIPAPL